jgi:hypothetical protein
MLRLHLNKLETLHDAWDLLQTAIGVEFGTLPPYLYALYTIRTGTNQPSVQRIKSVALQEMIHMCLACNILNALGGTPLLKPQTYPGPLPGSIGPDGKPLDIHLYVFSPKAMEQGMKIEEPADKPNFPVLALAKTGAPKAVTIGEFYDALDKFLATLPERDWHADRRQIVDNQFFPGQLFAVNNYADAHMAIQQIVSEGEGAPKLDDPLDFQHDLAHYYRFGEVFYDRVLTKIPVKPYYTYGPDKLGVDWTDAYPAIDDPGSHDFSKDSSAAQVAQDACNTAYTALVNQLQLAVAGNAGALGVAVRAMYDLRMTALHALTVPLADGTKVAGPAFLYQPEQAGNWP